VNVNSLAAIGCACSLWLVSGCGKAADPPEVKQADQPSQVVVKQEDPAPEGPIRFTAVARDWA